MKSYYVSGSKILITEKGVNNSSVKLISENSLLMVIRSGILKHTLPVAINSVPVTINQDMKAFTVDESRVKVRFLLYFFILYQKHLLRKVRSVTADNIEFGEIKKVGIIIPPIVDQDKFETLVEKCMEVKQILKIQLIEMELLRKSLIKNYFN